MGAKRRVVGKKRTRAQAAIPENSGSDSEPEKTEPETKDKTAVDSDSKPEKDSSTDAEVKEAPKKATAKKPTAKPTAKKPTAKPTAKPSKKESSEEDATESGKEKAAEDPKETPKEKDSSKDDKEDAKSEPEPEEKPKAKAKAKPKAKATAKPSARATGKRTTTAAPPPAKKRKVDSPSDDDDDDSEEEVARWKDWKKIYLVGTEWENYKSVFEINWDFDHLRKDLLEGFLNESPNKKYIFGTTEGFMLAPDPKKPDEQRVVLVPVVVVVDCKIPPPEKLGITSVQRGEETIKNMKDFKMEWIPYYDPATWKLNPSRITPKVFFLQCVQRETVLARLPLEFKKEYEYALPYIWLPKNQKPTQQDSNLQIVTTIGSRGVTFEFDYKYDEIDEMVDNYLTTEEDKKKYRAEFEATIKKHVEEAKQKIKDDRARIEKEKEALGAAKLEALNALQCYKYYPQNPEYKIDRASYVNRYYGKANRVFPEPQAAVDYSTLKPVIDTPMPDAAPADSDTPKSDPGPSVEPAAEPEPTKPPAKKGGRKATAKPSAR